MRSEDRRARIRPEVEGCCVQEAQEVEEASVTGQCELILGRRGHKGDKFKLGHVEFGGISILSFPLGNLVQDRF